MNHILFTSLFILLGGLLAPSSIAFQDKHITSVDKLAGFIQHKNPKLQHEETYHIASALITKGGSDVRILASIACVESQFTPHAVGDSGASVGMFQIQPLVWGSFRSDVYSQTTKARTVVSSLKLHTDNYVARYNGSGPSTIKYKRKVYAVYNKLKFV